MLKMITVPSNTSFYKYSFKMVGDKTIYMGEFVSGCFWDADKMLSDILYSHNKAEWINDPGLYGANLAYDVKLWKCDKKKKHNSIELVIDNINNSKDYTYEDDIEKHDIITQRILCMFGMFMLALIMLIGIFGDSIINMMMGYKQ